MYYIIEELTREFQSAMADYRLTDNSNWKRSGRKQIIFSLLKV